MGYRLTIYDPDNPDEILHDSKLFGYIDYYEVALGLPMVKVGWY